MSAIDSRWMSICYDGVMLFQGDHLLDVSAIDSRWTSICYDGVMLFQGDHLLDDLGEAFSSGGGLANIPLTLNRWTEESRVLDGDAAHDYITGIFCFLLTVYFSPNFHLLTILFVMASSFKFVFFCSDVAS